MYDVVLWKGLTDEERLQLMFKVHFLKWGNIESFIDKAQCRYCYDYGKERIHRDCTNVDKSTSQILACMKEQAQEPIYTLEMPSGPKEHDKGGHYHEARTKKAFKPR
jgi:hypothetical protein